MLYIVLLLAFVLLPLYLTLKYKNPYWKLSVGILLAVIPTLGYAYYDANHCDGFLCGITTGIVTLEIVSLLIGLGTAIGLIRKKNNKLLFIIFLVPALLIASAYGYDYYNAHRTGSSNPYTYECKQAGYDGARGRSCYCVDTNPSSACCQRPGASCHTLPDKKIDTY